MITLYLVRHGETEYNRQGRIQGQGDSPLTPLGVLQAEAVATRLAGETFAAIYSSDLGRAQSTAEIIAARHNLPVQTTPLLREAAFGIIQGLTRAEVETRFPIEEHEWRRDPRTHRPPGAEYPEDVIERCRRFLAEVIERHPSTLRQAQGSGCTDGERLLVVGHGGSVRGIVVASILNPPSTASPPSTLNPPSTLSLSKGAAHFYRSMHFSNAGLSIVDVGDSAGIHVLNDTCHLAGVAVTDQDADNA
ncbi:MAG: histidine phosphatase family protein [Armatimonadetes bacterium]|nr:histidine phosphatase family protein [Armatimonadota bacterium]